MSKSGGTGEEGAEVILEECFRSRRQTEERREVQDQQMSPMNCR